MKMKMKKNIEDMQMKNFIWKAKILNNCILFNNIYIHINFIYIFKYYFSDML